MNKINDIRVRTPGFEYIPKDMNQMTVMFKTKADAEEALASGKLTEKGRVIDANFDWQNRKDWGGQVWIKWERI